MRAHLYLLVAFALLTPAGHAVAGGNATAAKTSTGPADTVGLTEVARITPDGAIADGAIAGDGGTLLAYGWTDQSAHAEIRIVDTTTGAQVRVIDVSGLSVRLDRVAWHGAGDTGELFVVGRTEAGDTKIAALYDATGKELRRFGPAEHVALVQRPEAKATKGRKKRKAPAATGAMRDLVVTYQVAAADVGDVHTVEAFDPDTGKRVGKPHSLELADNRDAKLDFTLNHWSDDFTVAVGVKGGSWNKRTDMRSPDVEAHYDMIAGAVVSTAPIEHLYEHAARYQVLAQFPNQRAFARASDSLGEIELWRDEQKTVLELDQTLDQYDLKSSRVVRGQGDTLVVLRVDPWNVGSVQRRRADPEYLDLFRVDDAGKGRRVARILAPKKKFTLGVAGGRLWVVERNVGFDGGKSLALYTIDAP
ncbi:MAG: hypothetical protein KC464_22885 [Myxococcales bacterium]|nr:hypothetical protein [Myxococcales bacterium]